MARGFTGILDSSNLKKKRKIDTEKIMSSSGHVTWMAGPISKSGQGAGFLLVQAEGKFLIGPGRMQI
jgi:hypothetical protein